MPSIYIGINLPIFAIALLPANNLISIFCVTAFLLCISCYCYYQLNKMLVSERYLLVDEKQFIISYQDGKKIGEISPFSIVTQWFVIIKFKRQPAKNSQLIILNALSQQDKRRLLRAVYHQQ